MKTTDWFEEWLAHYVKPASKQKTYRRYEEIVAQHILPKFGEMEREGITPLVLQRYISKPTCPSSPFAQKATSKLPK